MIDDDRCEICGRRPAVWDRLRYAVKRLIKKTPEVLKPLETEQELKKRLFMEKMAVQMRNKMIFGKEI